jgi:hypothetical protein
MMNALVDRNSNVTDRRFSETLGVTVARSPALFASASNHALAISTTFA